MTNFSIQHKLRGSARHPYMDNTCKVNVFVVNDAADLIDEMLRALKIARTWSDKDWVGHEHVERAIAKAEGKGA